MAPPGGAPVAPPGGAPVAPPVGAPVAPSGGAPMAPPGGAPTAPSGGASVGASGEAPITLDLVIQSFSRSQVGSGSPSESLELDRFSLSESLPDIENSPIAVIHQTDDGEKVGALAVGQKRPYTPSPQSSPSSKEKQKANVKSSTHLKSEMLKNKNKNSKSSLPKPLNRKREYNHRKVQKSK